MNRRQMMILPGAAAVLAREGLADVGSATSASTAAARISKKAMKAASHPKASYKIPKSEGKKDKYVNFLSTLLTLNPSQKEQAAAIFTSAVNTRKQLRSDLKTARQSLRDAVRNNDSAAISQISASIGNIRAQLLSNAASANASFYQILAADQQATLAQFQS